MYMHGEHNCTDTARGRSWRVRPSRMVGLMMDYGSVKEMGGGVEMRGVGHVGVHFCTVAPTCLQHEYLRTHYACVDELTKYVSLRSIRQYTSIHFQDTNTLYYNVCSLYVDIRHTVRIYMCSAYNHVHLTCTCVLTTRTHTFSRYTGTSTSSQHLHTRVLYTRVEKHFCLRDDARSDLIICLHTYPQHVQITCTQYVYTRSCSVSVMTGAHTSRIATGPQDVEGTPTSRQSRPLSQTTASPLWI